MLALKLKLKGTMEKVPPLYAPGNYHHPLPTLACTKSCLKECLPGIEELELQEDIHDVGPVTIAAKVTYIYKGQAVSMFLSIMAEVVARHTPKNTEINLLLSLTPEVALVMERKAP